MTNTRIFIDMLAPLFIAIIALAGLAALINLRITAAVIGLGGLGFGGLAIVVIGGLLTDAIAHLKESAQLKSPTKNR
ncbi:hypothetical protein [Levilactobacillus yonginensis]|uniref:hypothetical protein n=1 Tax=Levilactobacillus yonginensis TaxID=1054041 RepID=UPI00345CDD2A